MSSAQSAARDVIERNPEWYHSIELAPGVITPGRRPHQAWLEDLKRLELPDLHGKSVLDIGAYDGFYSFSAEKLGAKRVVALDHYVWSTDMAGYMSEWRVGRAAGNSAAPPHETPHWRPKELPGRRPFDAARECLRSRVEPVVGDFETMELSTLGTFDVVLFLGVLYHLENPISAIRRLAQVTSPGGVAVIETQAIDVLGLGDARMFEFFPGTELNNDPTNWWAPTASALEGLCRTAGFRESRVLNRPRLTVIAANAAKRFGTRLRARLKRRSSDGHVALHRYRAFAHAFR